jgi:hypothetical protein
MPAKDLQPKVDYFYCDDCKEHVPCIRLEPGVWEVQCARCIGECSLCGCHLSGYCFGKGQDPVSAHMYIVKPHAGR